MTSPNGATWTRSSRCEGGQCIEARRAGTVVHLRDTAQPDHPAMAITLADWRAFLAGAKAGDFDHV